MDRNLMSTSICPFSTQARSKSAEILVSSFIADPEFPCLGAKSALNRHRMRFGHYAALCDETSVKSHCADLLAFSNEFPQPGVDPVSFVATFASADVDEAQFESLIWRHFQLMHDADKRRFAWDPSVSADPAHKDFSLSVAGRAFFVVGLHPNASRMARRAPMPCLVFNFHNQFLSLKQSAKYGRMQTAIRARDTALQGSVNPVLAMFGDASEARQYSGRAVEENWLCPFRQGGGWSQPRDSKRPE
ncbi:MAG: guanitoxin biosynthesis heme-dependent pre-guanitoxin N-hydroxylase GntA [Betaproteobacteria bacterium]